MTTALRIGLAMLTAGALAGCGGQPHAGLGIGIGPGGVSVNPVVGASFGGVGVSVSPAIN